MTLIASLLFASALVAAVGSIILTIQLAMPRIFEVIEAEFSPSMKTERRINFGPVKQRQIRRADVVVPLRRSVPAMPDFKLAA
ncbi:MAG: hypothetical protein WBO17_15055 [Sphingorhabdus sp.]